MVSIRTRAVAAVAVAASAALVLTACGSGSTSSNGGGSTGPTSSATGGTLYYYNNSAFEHLDPQRVYIGNDLTNLNRTVYRSLVSLPATSDPAKAATPVPDLATTTGKSTDGAKTWSFTLKSGITWQDGKPITCEDFKYGASRGFATDVITGGPNYLLSYLDVPHDPKTGLPTYTGPYNSTPAATAAFNKAIVCNGNTITYHFNKPWPDFPEAIAALGEMDPYRKDKDQGAKSDFSIFSDGPYEVQGSVNPKSGFTLVRNPNYKASTDSPDIRKALPDSIVFKVLSSDSLTQQLISNTGEAQSAVTMDRVQPKYYPQLVGAVNSRVATVQSPYVDYLVPNFGTLTNPLVRQALSVATNDQGWINAMGGTRAADPASSVVNPSVHGYVANPAFTRPSSGDVDKAKQLLQQAGVKLPYPITFTYRVSSDTYTKAAEVLQQTWDQAGFKVTLNPITNVSAYYAGIQSNGNNADVMWAGWGADWPSLGAVTPALFDSTVNLTSGSRGQDYGQYKSAAANALFTKAGQATTIDEQTKYLQQADQQLGKDTAYIPLEVEKFNLLRGSKVTNFLTDAASNGYPDLGAIGVQQ